MHLQGCLARKHCSECSLSGILVPRGRAPFGQHQEITTSGHVQRDPGSDWLCKHNRIETGRERIFNMAGTPTKQYASVETGVCRTCNSNILTIR